MWNAIKRMSKKSLSFHVSISTSPVIGLIIRYSSKGLINIMYNKAIRLDE